MYAVWARRGFMPDVVDEWPIEWSGGWLFHLSLELEQLPESWRNQPIGFGGDTPGDDPWWDAPAEAPPPGWDTHLPMYVPPADEGVSGGE